MIRSRIPIRTDAVVLKTFKSGDADRVVILFTEKFGKLKAIVKGVRKASSRFRVAVEVGNIISTSLYYKDKHQEFGRIIDMDSWTCLMNLRSDYTRILTMNYLLNVIDEAWQMNDAHPESFELLVNSLELLENAGTDDEIKGLVRAFELRTLFFLGIHPSLEVCGICEKKTMRPSLNFQSMTVYCDSCLSKRPSLISTIPLKAGFLKFYRQCTNASCNLPAQALSKETEQQSRLFFRHVFLDFLGHHLNVLKIRDSLKKKDAL